jgi:hypothetical protein
MPATREEVARRTGSRHTAVERHNRLSNTDPIAAGTEAIDQAEKIRDLQLAPASKNLLGFRKNERVRQPLGACAS